MTRPTPTRSPRAETTTGIPRDCLYRLPEGILRLMRTWPLERDALRLLHVLLYRTCRGCRDWRSGTGPQPAEGYGAALRDVHLWQGTRPDRGNGAILAAMAPLRVTGAFEEIEAYDGNRVLHWCLTGDAYTALFADEAFGYLDARILSHLRDALALRLLGEIALVRGMARPMLSLDVEDLHRMGGFQGSVSWKTVRRSLLTALTTIGTYHGLRILVWLRCHNRLVGIDTPHIRIEHAETVWATTALGRSDLRAREVIVVDPAGERRMRRAALPAYLAERRRMPV